MINRVTVQPTPVTVGGAQWPVLFTFRGWAPLVKCYGGLNEALEALACGDQGAVLRFFWAGLLFDEPGLKLDDVAGLLNEATLPELTALPAQLLDAVRNSMPENDGDDESGDPWDFEIAEAAWSTEWGQDADKFWNLTFREFHAKSNGRAKLYKKAKNDGSGDGGNWSGTLEELLMLGRRGR